MTIPKTAFVTGAARRIGKAIACDLAAWGWSVAVHYNRSAADAEAVVAEIESQGGVAVALQADLADEKDTKRLMAQAVERFGPIGCLVNNASHFDRDGIQDATRESWDAHMQPNLRAPFVLSQDMAAALPADREGVIVNILDQRVWNLTPHFLSYTLSKTGLWTLTQTLALALAPRIRVNGIGPGPTLRNVRQTEEQFRRQQESVPLRRGASSAEMARAVRFIIESPSMTGQMIALDGGQHLGWRQPLDEAAIDE
jgi:NAD(P)-dependent dehydrogenase (short-subunit alcohol dehydrogenase family)